MSVSTIHRSEDTSRLQDLILYVRYFSEGTVDPIAVIAGLVQTGLYLDFFYIYFTKCVTVVFCMLLLITHV